MSIDRPKSDRALREEERVLPVVEEQVTTGRRSYERGRLRVRRVTSQRDQYVEEALLQESADIKRVPVDREVDGPVEVRYEGDTIIVPVVEEVLVVEKRLVLVEELHITRQRTQVREVRRVPVRRSDVIVERVK